MRGRRPALTLWRRTSSTRGGGSAGFTLVEMMVVLVIIALLSAMVLPSVLNTLRDDSVDAAGTKLAETLRFAALTAVTRHHTVRADFDTQTGRCIAATTYSALPWIEADPKTGPEILAIVRLPDGIGLTLTREASEGMNWVSLSGHPSLTFRPDGQADGATLVLTDPAGRICTIDVAGATGNVSIREDES